MKGILTAFFLLMINGSLFAQSPLFSPAINYNIGHGIAGITAADFDNDGDNDLVVEDNDSYTIKILSNDGNGSFTQIAEYSVGANPGWAVAEDFNNDGRLDLAVNSDWTHNISVFWGNGDCTFQFAYSLGTDGRNGEVIAIDIDNDSNKDLLIPVFSATHIACFKNNGNGTFQDVQYVDLGGSPSQGIYSNDFDNDNDADVAIESGAQLKILLNNGAGEFSDGGSYPICSGSYSTNGGDIDNDGDIDIVSVNGSCNQIIIFLNDGTGIFSAGQTYPAGDLPIDAELADFNNDGNLDIAVADKAQSAQSGSCMVFLGNGDGTFSLENSYLTGQWTQAVYVARLDNDFNVDLVTANFGSGTISVFINNLPNIDLIIPDSGSIVNDADLTMTWHRVVLPDSVFSVLYGIFLDEDSLFASPDSSEILSDTTYTFIDTLNRSQSYFWKIRALVSNGSFLLSKIWSFYLNGYPTQPAPFAPENGRYADSSTVFSWYLSTDPDSFDAVSYTIQIDSDSAFESPEINQSGLQSGTVADDAFAVRLGELDDFDSLDIDTRYFWRVRADDNYGLSSDWTDGANWFVFMAQNHPPSPPDSGFSPANSEEVISLTPVITWNIADDPDPDDFGDNLSYAIRISQDSLFTGFVYGDTTEIGINQIQPTSELQDNSHYFYQVNTIDDGGLSSDWSAIQNFWTNHYNFPPEPFLVYGPEDGEKQVVYYTHFSWGSTIDYDPNSSFTYAIQFSADSAFNWIQRQIVGITDTVIAVPTDSLALISQHPYWRVVAVDDDSLIRIGGISEGSRQLVILPPGDANTNGVTNGLDVTFLVSYLKGIGPAPDPLLAGDANGSCQTNGLDVVYLVSYFKGSDMAPVRPNCETTLFRGDFDRVNGKSNVGQ